MRAAAVVIAVLVACGDNRHVPDAAPDAPPACAPVRGTSLSLKLVATSCFAPGAPVYPGCIDGTATLVTSPPGDPRLFVIEQQGRIRIIDHGQLAPVPFLDFIDSAVPPIVAVSELGLLGLAFHPQFATNHTFFVYYTALSGDPVNPYFDVVERFTTLPDHPDRADPASATVVLAIPDFAGNHNGGMIEFGPDGRLYISTGDGGNAYDPQRTGQDTTSLLGKMLRIDVDAKEPGREYGSPVDNPFSAGGGRAEIFMLGLRNPWRWAFDRATGDMWIGDVGQDLVEEVDVARAGEQLGKNFGWSEYEGLACLNMPCDPAGKTFAQDNRTHAAGWCAVIGGDVYRGQCYPDLVGTYIYTDYCRQLLSTARLQADGSLAISDLEVAVPRTLPGTAAGPASLHAAAGGELYLTDTQGNVYHVEAGP